VTARSASAVPAPSARDDLAHLRHVTAAVETVAAVDTARRLGVFGRMATSPRTAAEVADDLRLDPRGVSRLLDTLVRLGLLHAGSEGSFKADPAAVRCIELIADGWAELPMVLRTGTPITKANTADGAGRLYPDAVALLAAWFAPAAARLAELLSSWSGEILDVGAGAAPWSIAIAAGDERIRVTAVDVPDVLPATRRAVDHAGLASQFRYLAGDVFTLDLPSATYDLLIVGNLCHLFDAEQNRTLLSILRRTIRPGGRLAIIDVLPSTDPTEQRAISRYELGLLLRTEAGQVYPFPAYLDWTTEAGFVALTQSTLSADPPISLVFSGPAEIAQACNRGK
jgi:ubiquinone/menaquinone biosynthesis C-methylase UbiE